MAANIPKVDPPWMQSATEVNGEQMLVVHIQNGELEGLDTLQGGPSIDPETGIREYSKLSSIIEQPQIKQIFQRIYDEIKATGQVSPEINALIALGKQNSLPYSPTRSEEHNPLLSIEKTGRHGDTKMALVPLSFIKLLLEVGYQPTLNPETGLIELFWPMALIAAGSLASAGASIWAANQAHEDAESNRNAMMQHQEMQIAAHDRHMEKMGFYKPWVKKVANLRVSNPNYRTMPREAIKHGRMTESPFIEYEKKYAKGGHVKSYNHGALVSGPGKGQDDKIKTSVPKDSYISRADITADWGDGSSSAGAEVLKKFEHQIKNKFPKDVVMRVEKAVKKDSQQVPVWLSNDEYKYSPVTMTLLGNGSASKGAAIMKEAEHKLRKHKISNGVELSPKAKHPLDYINMKGGA